MSPDSLESYRQLTSEMTLIRESVARIETRIESLSDQRKESLTGHTACREEIDRELKDLRTNYTDLVTKLNRLITWGRSVAMLGTVTLMVLTIINVLLSISVRM